MMDAPKDGQLMREFAESNTPEGFVKFFGENVYEKINYADCKKIRRAKEEFGLEEWPPPSAY